MHIGCVGAIAIIAVGYTKFEKVGATTSDMGTGIDMVHAGSIILLVVWLGIAAIAAISFLYPRQLKGEKQVVTKPWWS